MYQRTFLNERLFRASKGLSGDLHPAKDEIYRGHGIMARIAMVFYRDGAYMGTNLANNGERIKDVNSRYDAIRRELTNAEVNRFTRLFRGLDRLVSAFATSSVSSSVYVDPFHGLVLYRYLSNSRSA